MFITSSYFKTFGVDVQPGVGAKVTVPVFLMEANKEKRVVLFLIKVLSFKVLMFFFGCFLGKESHPVSFTLR